MVKKRFHEALGQTADLCTKNIGADKGNTDHTDWPELDASHLHAWENFNARTFRYLYPSLWISTVNCLSLRTPPRQITYITGEDSVVMVLAAVIQICVCALLEDIKDQLGREIWLGATSLGDLGSRISTSNRPDWHCCVSTDALKRMVSFCPGDTKSGNKFGPDELFPSVNPQYEYENMLPFRQIAHYTRLAGTRYGFLVTERGFIAIRVSFEEARRSTSPQIRGFVPRRVAAPTPGTMRVSGMSSISETFSSMSLDSFAPEDPTDLEIALFPWNSARDGLTGFGAWVCLLIIATEERGNFDRHHGSSYLPLHSVTKTTTPAKHSKHGKEAQSAKSSYTSLLTGETSHDAPPDWVNIHDLESEQEPESGSGS